MFLLNKYIGSVCLLVRKVLYLIFVQILRRGMDVCRFLSCRVVFAYSLVGGWLEMLEYRHVPQSKEHGWELLRSGPDTWVYLDALGTIVDVVGGWSQWCDDVSLWRGCTLDQTSLRVVEPVVMRWLRQRWPEGQRRVLSLEFVVSWDDVQRMFEGRFWSVRPAEFVLVLRRVDSLRHGRGAPELLGSTSPALVCKTAPEVLTAWSEMGRAFENVVSSVRVLEHQLAGLRPGQESGAGRGERAGECGALEKGVLQEEAHRALEKLGRFVGVMEDIFETQQRAVSVEELEERLSIAELFEEALRFHRGEMQRRSIQLLRTTTTSTRP